MPSIRLFPSAFLLALVACQPTGQDTPPAAESRQAAATPARHRPGEARWQCGDLRVATRFDDPALDTITVVLPDRTLLLEARDTADGALFADRAGNRFQSRPGQVSLTIAGRPPQACRKGQGASP